LLSVSSHTKMGARMRGAARNRLRTHTVVARLPPSPGGRFNHQMMYDKDANLIWLYGGEDPAYSALNDLWAMRLEQNNKWQQFKASTDTQYIAGPIVWPPASKSWTSAVLTPVQNQPANRKLMYLFGPTHNVWSVDVFGNYLRVDVCVSSPCINGGQCLWTADNTLGGGAGYACRCPTGYSGRICQNGDTVFSHINNPFMKMSKQVEDIVQWKPIDEITKRYPSVPAYVPKPVPQPACCSPKFPITVGPAYVPNTDTRTVQVWRDPNAPPRELPVDLQPNLAWDPSIITHAQNTLRSTARKVESTHDRVKAISDAPLKYPIGDIKVPVRYPSNQDNN